MHLVPARALGRAAALALAVLLAPVGTVAVDLAAPQAVCAEPSKALKEEALPIIQEGLKSDDPQTKAWAILAAGALGDKNLNKELAPYLANTNRELRQAAIVALAGQKDKAGLDALRKELADAKGGRFVVMADLLSRLPVGPRVELLKEFALGKKPDAGLRADALRYLAERFLFRLPGSQPAARTRTESVLLPVYGVVSIGYWLVGSRASMASSHALTRA